jgi:hypothetical protein
MDIITDYRISSAPDSHAALDLAAERARIARERSAVAEARRLWPVARRLHLLATSRPARPAN